MKNRYCETILEKYKNKEINFKGLFQTILSIYDEIGLEKSLEYLEKCVIEKRLSLLNGGRDKIEKSGNPIDYAYRIFYKIY